MNSYHFISTKEISRVDWKTIAVERLKVRRIEWEDGAEDISSDDGPIAFIQASPDKGDFRFRYDVYLREPAPTLSKRAEVDFYSWLTHRFDCEILTSEEGPDPYLFVHVTPRHVRTVGVKPEPYDNDDELYIDGPWPLVFGAFSTEVPLDQAEEAVLQSSLNPVLGEYQLSWMKVDDMRNDFTNARTRIDALRDFRFHYFIQPSGNSAWYSQDERSELLIRVMKEFHSKSNRTVCVFPSNATNVQNIPGGSDSESFCILLGGRGEEKIIYKPRRARW